jgi:hypothetical protein
MGFYPYSFRHRWNVDLHVLSLLNLASIICIVYNLVSCKKIMRSCLLYISFILYACVSIFYLYVSKFRYNEYEKTTYLLEKIENSNIRNIAIPYSYYPNVRYIYEYGIMKNNAGLLYPDRIFYYEKDEEINFNATESIISLHNIDLDNWTKYVLDGVFLYTKCNP